MVDVELHHAHGDMFEVLHAELKFEAVGDTAVHYCLSTHQGPSTHCKHGCFFMVTIFAAIAN